MGLPCGCLDVVNIPEVLFDEYSGAKESSSLCSQQLSTGAAAPAKDVCEAQKLLPAIALRGAARACVTLE